MEKSDLSITPIKPVDGNRIVTASEDSSTIVKENLLIWTWLNDKSPNSKKTYERIIREFFLTVKKTILEVQTPDISFFVFQNQPQLSKTTRKLYLSTISSFFVFLNRQGYRLDNACLPINKIKIDRLQNMRVPTEDQVKQIFNKVKDLRELAISYLLFYGALRVSELSTLTWDQVKRRPSGVRITIHGKGNKIRFVMIPVVVFNEVEKLKCDSSKYVLRPKKGSSAHLSVRQIEDIVRDLGRRAKLDFELHPHAFRHGHATIAHKKGASMRVIQQTLGHSSISTTEIYTRVEPDESSGNYL